jgi:hypothetical protein
MDSNIIWAIVFGVTVLFLSIRLIMKYYFPPDT